MLGNGHHHKPWPGQETSASYSSFIICSRDGSFPSACQASAETVLSLISSFKACPHVNSHFINSPHIFLFEYAVCFLWSPLLNRYTTQVMNEKINTATPRQRTLQTTTRRLPWLMSTNNWHFQVRFSVLASCPYFLFNKYVIEDLVKYRKTVLEVRSMVFMSIQCF